ncbi:asparagine--tRNA ligase [Spirochaeta africana]|uniref:Asparagine--tRNA ligase n=1 Tax=Spirochaeta africana (strain ATCC 700263 / DSM 8902 / Z-7692) TaxID=889378 RepID=H9UIC0_SPIAZ|nr:asparagine--tRNA ligase [Spirochaeta africana]AFG37263.1 asparaginyl-tRNA synthetase [Spirochaeta africana DSM 8902]
MDNQRVRQLLASSPGDARVATRGWVRTHRDTKDIVFIELNDGSCLKNLQIIIDKAGPAGGDQLKRLATGAAVTVEGKLVESPGKNQAVELHADRLTVVGDCPADYPLQKKRHSFEYLREIAHLRPRTNAFGAIARVRNNMSTSIHRFFQDRGFLWIHTPIITGIDAEGAGEMFQVTTMPLDKLAGLQPTTIDYSRDFFGKPAYLAVTGQLQAEVYACALDRAYTFGPTFRAENSNTVRHLAEFWMIEPELAFCDLEANMDLAEDFVRTVISDVLNDCPEDMQLFDQRIQKGLIESLQAVARSPFKRISYTEAIAQLKDSGIEFTYPPEWGAALQTEHEKCLTEQIHNCPVIVYDYPAECKAFYMKQNPDGKTVRAMDVLVPRLGEIIGGSQREDNLEKLESRMQAAGLNPDDYWWYLDLRRYGSVPHSGFGLGFERLIQYVTGMQNIRDVIPFPRTVKHADF